MVESLAFMLVLARLFVCSFVYSMASVLAGSGIGVVIVFVGVVLALVFAYSLLSCWHSCWCWPGRLFVHVFDGIGVGAGSGIGVVVVFIGVVLALVFACSSLSRWRPCWPGCSFVRSFTYLMRRCWCWCWLWYWRVRCNHRRCAGGGAGVFVVESLAFVLVARSFIRSLLYLMASALGLVFVLAIFIGAGGGTSAAVRLFAIRVGHGAVVVVVGGWCWHCKSYKKLLYYRSRVLWHSPVMYSSRFCSWVSIFNRWNTLSRV